MKNQRNNHPWLRLLGGLATSALLALSMPALAQDEIDDAVVDDAQEVEEITVTGSRIKRNTYTSVAPLQVITSEVSRNLGAIDPGFALVGLLGLLLTNMALLGNLSRIERKILFIEIDTLAIVIVYLLGLLLLFVRGSGV